MARGPPQRGLSRGEEQEKQNDLVMGGAPVQSLLGAGGAEAGAGEAQGPGGHLLGPQGPAGRLHVTRRGWPAARAGPGRRRAWRPAPWTPGIRQGPRVAGREGLHDEQQADDEQEGARDLLVSSCPKDRVSVNMIF